MKAVLLKHNGYIQEISLTITKKKRATPVSLYYKQFKKYITRARNTVHIEVIDNWMINSKSKLVAYGISKEHRGTDVNKHELLPTDNNKKYYGDILIIKTDEENKIEDVTADQYEKYYNQMYNLDNFDSSNDDSEADFDFSTMIEQYSSYNSDTSLGEDSDTDVSECENSDTDVKEGDNDSKIGSSSSSPSLAYALQPIINSSQYRRKIKNMIKELEYEEYSIDSI